MTVTVEQIEKIVEELKGKAESIADNYDAFNNGFKVGFEFAASAFISKIKEVAE